jgi:hypothetical protein
VDLRGSPSDTVLVFVQVLDTNDEGVNSAHVVFTRTDASRIVWRDAAEGSDAISIETGPHDAQGIVGDGVAMARARIPANAPLGEAAIVAVLKQPADAEKTIALRLNLEVVAAGEGGAGGAGASSGAGGAGNGGQGGDGGELPVGGGGGESNQGGSGGESNVGGGGAAGLAGAAGEGTANGGMTQ